MYNNHQQSGETPDLAACDHDTGDPGPRLGLYAEEGWQGVEELHRWLARRSGGRRDHSDVGTRVGGIRHRAKGSR